jgi:hypothetical protein
MFFLQFISTFIKVMRAGASPAQIAGGFALGSLIGLMPFLTLQSVIIFCIIFLLNVNLSAATFAIFVASFGAFLLDPLFHHLGFYMLTGIAALLVVAYREGLEAKIKQWKIVQVITGSKLWQWYEKLRDWQW